MPSVDERNLWLPPRGMRRYQLAKALGGALVLLIFVGWLFIQWSNLAMRLLATALILITLYVVIVSIAGDRRRALGRQISIDGQVLNITTPEGTASVLLPDVAIAEWRDEPAAEAGLQLLSQAGQRLVRIDAAFLTDEAEARAFLGWLRDRSGITLKTKWPT
jgi:small-conductance mechanosensitive channel